MKVDKNSDDAFIKLWNKLGSPTLVAKELCLHPRSVLNKRSALQLRYGIVLDTHNSQRRQKKEKPKKITLAAHNVRRGIDIDKVKNIWASLPGAGYGQHENKLDKLITAYKDAGGTVA